MKERYAHEFSLAQTLMLALLPRPCALSVRALARSWRLRSILPEASDPRTAKTPTIYAMWHEAVITNTALFRDHNVQGLASRSFDGAMISAVMVCLGYPPVSRGSSSRGGLEGLMAHVKALQEGRHVAVTVDGPRGPYHVAKNGVLRMAQETGFPIVTASLAVSPDLRLRNWDRTQIPPPFAKIGFYLSEPLAAEKLSVESGLELLHQTMRDGDAAAVELLKH